MPDPFVDDSPDTLHGVIYDIIISLIGTLLSGLLFGLRAYGLPPCFTARAPLALLP